MNKIKKLKNGDNAEFELFYNKHAKTVYYAAYAILKDEGLSEQIMQDVFVKFYLTLKDLDEDKNAVAYVCTISRNLAINLYNRRKKEVYIEDEKFDFFKDKSNVHDGELIDVAAKSLTETEFKILMLFIDGYKRREVAKIMEKPMSTVYYIYTSALKKLKKILEET